MPEPQQKPGRSKQDYRTPPEFLLAVRRLLGIQAFAWDVAASPENAVAHWYYTQANSGLTNPWAADGWNWCNPPFGDIEPWVQRAAVLQSTAGVCTAVLIPASVDANYWEKWVHARAAVHFVQGRIQFVGAEYNYPKPLALCLYGWMAQYRPWRWRDALKAVA